MPLPAGPKTIIDGVCTMLRCSLYISFSCPVCPLFGSPSFSQFRAVVFRSLARHVVLRRLPGICRAFDIFDFVAGVHHTATTRDLDGMSFLDSNFHLQQGLFLSCEIAKFAALQRF
jgi:hypothetical protein